jgi:uncharacterized protein (DUF433 family)
VAGRAPRGFGTRTLALQLSVWDVGQTEQPRGAHSTHGPPALKTYTSAMNTLARITADPEVMGGRPCIRGMRVTVGTVVGLIATGHSQAEILGLYPYLEREDISEALAYAAWRSDEFEVPISSS